MRRPNPPPRMSWCSPKNGTISHTIECFGVNRCMFESNFPVDKLSISYAVLWNAFKKMVADFSEDEKQALFYGTAAKVYRLRLWPARVSMRDRAPDRLHLRSSHPRAPFRRRGYGRPGRRSPWRTRPWNWGWRASHSTSSKVNTPARASPVRRGSSATRPAGSYMIKCFLPEGPSSRG